MSEMTWNERVEEVVNNMDGVSVEQSSLEKEGERANVNLNSESEDFLKDLFEKVTLEDDEVMLLVNESEDVLKDMPETRFDFILADESVFSRFEDETKNIAEEIISGDLADEFNGEYVFTEDGRLLEYVDSLSDAVKPAYGLTDAVITNVRPFDGEYDMVVEYRLLEIESSRKNRMYEIIKYYEDASFECPECGSKVSVHLDYCDDCYTLYSGLDPEGDRKDMEGSESAEEIIEVTLNDYRFDPSEADQFKHSRIDFTADVDSSEPHVLDMDDVEGYLPSKMEESGYDVEDVKALYMEGYPLIFLDSNGEVLSETTDSHMKCRLCSVSPHKSFSIGNNSKDEETEMHKVWIGYFQEENGRVYAAPKSRKVCHNCYEEIEEALENL